MSACCLSLATQVANFSDSVTSLRRVSASLRILRVSALRKKKVPVDERCNLELGYSPSTNPCISSHMFLRSRCLGTRAEGKNEAFSSSEMTNSPSKLPLCSIQMQPTGTHDVLRLQMRYLLAAFLVASSQTSGHYGQGKMTDNAWNHAYYRLTLPMGISPGIGQLAAKRFSRCCRLDPFDPCLGWMTFGFPHNCLMPWLLGRPCPVSILSMRMIPRRSTNRERILQRSYIG